MARTKPQTDDTANAPEPVAPDQPSAAEADDRNTPVETFHYTPPAALEVIPDDETKSVTFASQPFIKPKPFVVPGVMVWVKFDIGSKMIGMDVSGRKLLATVLEVLPHRSGFPFIVAEVKMPERHSVSNQLVEGVPFEASEQQNGTRWQFIENWPYPVTAE